MSHERPSDLELNMIEQQAAAKAARINASLGEIETGGQFDFCDDCPLLNGHAPAKVAEARERVGWSLTWGAGFSGTVVDMQLEFPDGTASKPMVLDTFPGGVFTGLMPDAARANAVKRTHECEKPKRFPPIGPIAVKTCQALGKYKDPRDSW